MVEEFAPDAPGALERMRQFWRSVMGYPFFTATKEGVWHPPVDVYEKEDRIVVEVELPGMAGQQMDVSIDQDHLVVEGCRQRAGEHKDEESYYCERAVGDFHRVVHLPTRVDEESVVAQYEDGVLTVTLPKAAGVMPRKVEIS